MLEPGLPKVEVHRARELLGSAESVVQAERARVALPENAAFAMSEQELLRRGMSHDPGYVMVSPHDIRTVRIAQAEHRSVFTYGLCGCQSILVVSRGSDGSDLVTMSHYLHADAWKNQAALQSELSVHTHSGPVCHSAILVVPCTLDDLRHPDPQPHDPELVAEFIQIIREHTTRPVLIDVFLYDMFGASEGRSTEFLASWPSQLGAPVGLRVCGESRGALRFPQY